MREQKKKTQRAPSPPSLPHKSQPSSATRPTTAAGDPAASPPAGRGRRRREAAATRAPSPTRMLPRTVADTPICAFAPILGWRSPAS